MSDSSKPCGLGPSRLLCPWDFPGKNTGVGYHAHLQGIFPIQALSPCLLSLLYWQVDSLPLMPPGKPIEYYAAIKNYTLRTWKSIFSVKWEKNSKEVKLYTMWSQLFLFSMWICVCVYAKKWKKIFQMLLVVISGSRIIRDHFLCFPNSL